MNWVKCIFLHFPAEDFETNACLNIVWNLLIHFHGIIYSSEREKKRKEGKRKTKAKKNRITNMEHE